MTEPHDRTAPSPRASWWSTTRSRTSGSWRASSASTATRSGRDQRAPGAARRRARSAQFILLDINMPEMNGYEVCRRLKARAVRGIPVIFLTASMTSTTRSGPSRRAASTTSPSRSSSPRSWPGSGPHVHSGGRSPSSRSYQRLRALEQPRDDLVSMVVHDMRSPLIVLIGLLMLETATSAPGRRRPGEPDVRARSGRALNRMANDVLDVSRLEACRMPVNRAPAT